MHNLACNGFPTKAYPTQTPICTEVEKAFNLITLQLEAQIMVAANAKNGKCQFN